MPRRLLVCKVGEMFNERRKAILSAGMRNNLLILTAAACLIATAGAARAASCEAFLQAEGFKAAPWKTLGDVSGPQKEKNCVAMEKNFLGGQTAAGLSIPKESICKTGTIAVTIHIRVDAKPKPDFDAIVKTALGVDCPAKPKTKDEAPKKKDDAPKKPAVSLSTWTRTGP